MHKKSRLFIILILILLALALWIFKNKNTEITATNEPSPTPVSSQNSFTDEKAKAPSDDPVVIFLTGLIKETNLSFSDPSASDLFWNEGDTRDALKVYFAYGFYIEHLNASQDDETKVLSYMTDQGFVKTKFNESIGDDSHKVGYRKDNLVCKTDFSQYPEEDSKHVNIFCADATKGELQER